MAEPFWKNPQFRADMKRWRAVIERHEERQEITRPDPACALVLNVARDFSRFPGGRVYADGEYSGQHFRENYLLPALKSGRIVHVEMDGTYGYGTSWLDEAFGGLVRENDLSWWILLGVLVIRTKNTTLGDTVWAIIESTDARKTQKRP